MSGFRIDVDDRLSGPLGAMAAAAENFAPVMAEISEAVFDHTIDRFHHEYDPDGVPWEPSRRALDEGGRTLYDRGDLFNALDRESGDDYALVGVLGVGGPAIYAQIHQWGGAIRPRASSALNTPFGPRASVNMPKRSYLGIEMRDITATEQIVEAHLLAASEMRARA